MWFECGLEKSVEYKTGEPEEGGKREKTILFRSLAKAAVGNTATVLNRLFKFPLTPFATVPQKQHSFVYAMEKGANGDDGNGERFQCGYASELARVRGETARICAHMNGIRRD